MKSIDFQEFWNSTNKFYLVSNSNSDAIFLFLGVNLYNRISFSDQNSKNDINKKFVSPNVHRESISPEM